MRKIVIPFSTLLFTTVMLFSASGHLAAAEGESARGLGERDSSLSVTPGRTHSKKNFLRNATLLFEPSGRACESSAGCSSDDVARFTARGDGYELHLSASGAVFAAGETRLRLSWADANRAANAEPLEEQPGRIHYFVGKASPQRGRGMPLFGRVRYRDVYPGIDVEFYGTRARPEFDFVVHPGADPSLIRFAIDGAESVEQTAEGELTAIAGGLPLHLKIPRIYQPEAPNQSVRGGFQTLADGGFGFALGEHDPNLPLIIDPVLTFSTLIGGAYGDNAYDVAVDAEGSIYVTGLTHELDFLHTDGAVTAPSGFLSHIFVVKLNPDATALEYAAVIGGGAQDQARAIAVDAGRNVYLTGTTFSPDFPVTANALQPSFAGGNTDSFVVKLNAEGSELLYSSYLGGSRQEFGEGIAVDSAGNVYIAGSTLAADFPVLPDALQPLKKSDTYDAFLVKLDVVNPVMLASTFLGGTERDEILDLALDGDSNVVVTGATVSKDFPVTSGVFQPEHRGVTTAFVAKLTPDLAEILFATFLGGGTEDRGLTIALDPEGDIYVGGNTLSSDFPITLGALQGRFGSGSFFGDGFVAKVSAGGETLMYSTYLGGSSEDVVNGIAVDGTGQVTVAGATGSPEFPLSSGAIQESIAGLDDLFVTRLSADGSRVVYSTVLGGAKSDRALGVAAAGPGSVVVAGTTVSPDYPPTAGVVQPEVRGAESGGDALVLRLDDLFKPAFAADNVVNGASMLKGPIAPGEIITVFGTNLGPANLVTARLTEDGLLSSELGDVRVLFDGVAGPLVYVLDGQLSAVVPYTVAGGSVAVQVEYFGALSDPVSVAVTAASPALFTQNSQGWGPAAALNQDYRLNTASNPADRGSIVILYATGEGMTDQAVDGSVGAAPLPRPVLPITVTVGGKPAEVLYAGGAPGLVAGVMQINIRIPGDAPAGEGVMVVVDAGDIAGARWVTLAVR